jgi:hypothetical protein
MRKSVSEEIGLKKPILRSEVFTCLTVGVTEEFCKAHPFSDDSLSLANP